MMKGNLFMLNSLLICAMLLGCGGVKTHCKSHAPKCEKAPVVCKCKEHCNKVCVCKKCTFKHVVIVSAKGDKVWIPVSNVDFVKVNRDGEVYVKVIKKSELKASDVCPCLDPKTFSTGK